MIYVRFVMMHFLNVLFRKLLGVLMDVVVIFTRNASKNGLIRRILLESMDPVLYAEYQLTIQIFPQHQIKKNLRIHLKNAKNILLIHHVLVFIHKTHTVHLKITIIFIVLKVSMKMSQVLHYKMIVKILRG